MTTLLKSTEEKKEEIVSITKDLIGRYKNSNGVMVNEYYVTSLGKNEHIKVEEVCGSFYAMYVDVPVDYCYGFGHTIDAAIENLFE